MRSDDEHDDRCADDRDRRRGGDPFRRSRVPPPWRLDGHGYGLLYRRLPRTLFDGVGMLPAELGGRFVGGTAALVVADYERSEVGPYREMLFVPGRFRGGETTFYSVARGYVSAAAAAASGLHNWGLRREVAEIAFERCGGVERVVVRRAGRTLVSLAFSSGRFGLPATTDVVPSPNRTLMQVEGARALFTTVGGRGTLKRARLLEACFDCAELPDLGAYHPAVAVRLEGFHLALPHPRVEDLPAERG